MSEGQSGIIDRAESELSDEEMNRIINDKVDDIMGGDTVRIMELLQDDPELQQLLMDILLVNPAARLAETSNQDAESLKFRAHGFNRLVADKLRIYVESEL